MPFREQIKPLWEQSEMTLAQIAEVCNTSESSMSRYLNGKVTPPVDIAEKIIAVLGGENVSKGGQEMQTMIQHVRDIYEKQIANMEADHARQVASLQKDKAWLFGALILMFLLCLYLCADGVHGGWGFFQYPVG